MQVGTRQNPHQTEPPPPLPSFPFPSLPYHTPHSPQTPPHTLWYRQSTSRKSAPCWRFEIAAPGMRRERYSVRTFAHPCTAKGGHTHKHSCSNTAAHARHTEPQLSPRSQIEDEDWARRPSETPTCLPTGQGARHRKPIATQSPTPKHTHPPPQNTRTQKTRAQNSNTHRGYSRFRSSSQ